MDPRSSLVDNEYEEYRVRLKILAVEHEKGKARRDAAIQKKEFERKKLKLELQILKIRFRQEGKQIAVNQYSNF